jgi:radical SAM/Cys-rich protein
MNRFAARLADASLQLHRGEPEVLQLNVGRRCNLTCVHCHVNAGPKRREMVSRETLDRVLNWLERTRIPTVDLTGGAPEMIPDFRYLVTRLRGLGRRIIDRCNLTILGEPGYEDLGEFLAEHDVEIVASLPCYTADNVNAQRGDGVFDASVAALQALNARGYGTRLPLHLVYNPGGAFLPGSQLELEADYREALMTHFGITFHRLYTLTNLPVGRFAAQLRREGKYEAYLQLLSDAFNPATVPGLMCRTTLNVGWQGEVYDCDFNGMLGWQWQDAAPLFLWDLDPAALAGRAIATGEHCFGCTAGAGSSCGGAVVVPG